MHASVTAAQARFFCDTYLRRIDIEKVVVLQCMLPLMPRRSKLNIRDCHLLACWNAVDCSERDGPALKDWNCIWGVTMVEKCTQWIESDACSTASKIGMRRSCYVAVVK